MKTGNALFNKKKIKIQKGGSESGELLDRFLDKLNPLRIEARYHALTHARGSKLLEGVPTEGLHPFYRDCERAQNFSKYFWWALRTEK